jgi:hypothetical protein
MIAMTTCGFLKGVAENSRGSVLIISDRHPSFHQRFEERAMCARDVSSLLSLNLSAAVLANHTNNINIFASLLVARNGHFIQYFEQVVHEGVFGSAPPRYIRHVEHLQPQIIRIA